jgi:hypothetical protein
MLSYRHIGAITALFVIIGIGLGFSGFIALEYTQTQLVDNANGDFAESIGQLLVVVIFLQSGFVSFLLGSIVASIGAVHTTSSTQSLTEAVLSNSIASLVGFPLMVVLAVGIMLLAFDGGGSGSSGSGGSPVDLLQLVSQVAIITVPTVLVGAISAVLSFGSDRAS